MAEQKKCNLCGARFDVPGAVGTLDDHMAAFHAGKPKSARPESGDNLTPDEAVETLKAAFERIGELEDANATLSAENAELKAKLAEADGSAGNGEGSQSSGKKLENMTTAELEETAKAEGVDLSKATTNAERADAIAKARADRS